MNNVFCFFGSNAIKNCFHLIYTIYFFPFFKKKQTPTINVLTCCYVKETKRRKRRRLLAPPTGWHLLLCLEASFVRNHSGRVATASCHGSNSSHMERPRGTNAVINSDAICCPPSDPSLPPPTPHPSSLIPKSRVKRLPGRRRGSCLTSDLLLIVSVSPPAHRLS